MDEAKRLQSRIDNYDLYSYEYQKRFITSLTVVSGTSFGFCLTFSQKFDNPESLLINMLFSMWCFLAALVFSGALSIIMSVRYDRLGLSTTMSQFARRREIAEKTKKFDGVNKYISAEVYSEMGSSDYKIARRLYTLYLVFSIISAVLIVLGLAWPLILLSKNGFIS